MKTVILCLAVVIVAAVNAHRGRIVGGHDALIEDYPYQISIQLKENNFHFCGGSIYKPNVIITAAHCVFGRQPSELAVRAGSNNRETGGVLIAVKQIINSEKWDPQTIDSDFALLILSESLIYSDKIQPIELATEEPAPGLPAHVSGWGLLEENGKESPKILQALVIKTWERNDCQAILTHNVNENMMCAGVKEAGKTACQMDSGGPLVVDNKLVGVVSWGIGCGRANSPNVFTNVPKFLPWIASKLN